MATATPSTVAAHMAPAESSTSRRKPKITYQSPSAQSTPTIFTASTQQQKPRPNNSNNVVGSFASSSTPSKQPVWSFTTQNDQEGINLSRKKKYYPMAPPLPLYHPLGRLALSLPPLNAKHLGLPDPIRQAQETTTIPPITTSSGSRSSARPRRPAAKVRDVGAAATNADSPGSSNNTSVLNAASAVASLREPKERPSPRKKRSSAGGAGGGGGAAAKRKRKDADDGDASASYPAKRPSRSTRGGTRSSATAEPESPVISEAAAASVRSTPAVELPPPAAEERPTKRRTRSTRRDSSESSTSVSQNIVTTPVVAPVSLIAENDATLMQVDATETEVEDQLKDKENVEGDEMSREEVVKVA